MLARGHEHRSIVLVPPERPALWWAHASTARARGRERAITITHFPVSVGVGITHTVSTRDGNTRFIRTEADAEGRFRCRRRNRRRALVVGERRPERGVVRATVGAAAAFVRKNGTQPDPTPTAWALLPHTLLRPVDFLRGFLRRPLRAPLVPVLAVRRRRRREVSVASVVSTHDARSRMEVRLHAHPSVRRRVPCAVRLGCSRAPRSRKTEQYCPPQPCARA